MVYARQVSTAKRLIAKYGEPVTVTLQIVAQNPVKPWETSTVQVQKADKMAFFTVGTQVQKSIMLSPDKPYPVGSLLGYMAYSGYMIDMNTIVTRSDGTVLRVLNIDVLKPNSEPILFTVVFKQ